MLSWHTYAVILVPGLGLYACGLRRAAVLVWACLALVAAFCPLSSAFHSAAALQLLGILVSLRQQS